MLYSISRSVFNERVALCAAALFSVSEPVIFLGHLAAFDATGLFLLASATWIAVRWSGRRWPVFLLAAPLAALAVAVDYAAVLFVPAIAVLLAVAGWPARGRRALRYPPAFAAAVAALLYGALRLAGPGYGAAISATITARGGVSALAIGRESAAWGGVITVLALVGAAGYTLWPGTEPGQQIVPAGGRWRRAALCTLLAGPAFLAPVGHICLHTDVSLLKQIGFGLFFAAPMAGFGLVRLVGDRFSRRQVGVALWCTALVLGMSGSWSLYRSWPSSAPLAKALSAYLRPHARYLVEVPEVPIYYLRGRSDAEPGQFWSTSAITYADGKGRRLTGDAGFAAAIRAGYFRLVAYNDSVTPATDAVIASALESSPAYQLVAVLHLGDSNGPLNYCIWVAGSGSSAQLDSARPLCSVHGRGRGSWPAGAGRGRTCPGDGDAACHVCSRALGQPCLPGWRQVFLVLPHPAPGRRRPAVRRAVRRRDHVLGGLGGGQARARGRPRVAVLHHRAFRRPPVGACPRRAPGRPEFRRTGRGRAGRLAVPRVRPPRRAMAGVAGPGLTTVRAGHRPRRPPPAPQH
jgi:hypothetical protein